MKIPILNIEFLTLYLICIPIWIMITFIILKIFNKEVTVGDIFPSIMIGLFNPVATYVVLMLIVLSPLMFATLGVIEIVDNHKFRKIF